MNVKIAGGSKGVYANQGSCTGLVNYLQHEDLERLKQGEHPEFFFNQTKDDIRGQEVIKKIDSNKAQLSKSDAKYYSVILSPSVKELQHLSGDSKERSESIKAFIRNQVIPQYASGFGKGLTAHDILYFGKIHYERGKKTEDQVHVHLLVSRKDMANKKKLSPMTNHRGTSTGAVKGGFNREEFVGAVEAGFDKSTGYDRDITESFRYCQAMQSGDLNNMHHHISLRAEQEAARKEQSEIKPQVQIQQEQERPKRGVSR